MAARPETGARVEKHGPMACAPAALETLRPVMRATKQAVAQALAADAAVASLVPAASIYGVERAVLPVLPAVEIIGVSSERQANEIVRHELSVELTVAAAAEDDADALLDALVRAVRGRLGDAESSVRPIRLAGGGNVLVELAGVRWSLSAAAASGVILGAAIALSVAASE